MNRSRVLLLAIAVVTLLCRPLPAAEPDPRLTWDLVTVGPDTDLFSLWGHSALCVSTGDFERGHCFDFGIALEEDPLQLSLGTLRGKALFGVLKVPTRLLLAFYRFRDTFRQRLEIDAERGQKLLAKLEDAALKRKAYAYQPLFRNCTTELRDRLDEALAGRLRQGTSERSGMPLRQLAEAGLSGHVLPLALLALAGGSRIDRPSTSWERMGLPNGLMQAVAERLSAAPSRVFSRLDAPPPTNPAAGRIALILAGFLGCLAFWIWVRQFPRRVRSAEISLALGLFGASLVPLMGLLSTLPSLAQNWMLLALIPADALLCLPRARWQERYVVLRLAGLLLLAVAAGLGLIAPSIWIGLWLAGLPLALWLWARQRPTAPDLFALPAG